MKIKKEKEKEKEKEGPYTGPFFSILMYHKGNNLVTNKE